MCERLPLPIAVFEPLLYVFNVVIKRTLPSQITDFILLYDAHPFVGDAVRHVGIVVHAVGRQPALWRQSEMLDEPLRRHHALL